MKKRNYIFRVLMAAAAVPVVAGTAGCSRWINDYEGDCETVYEVQFVYDRNLKWADAFGSEVDAVTLHVFDAATGVHVLSRTEQGGELARDGYAMRLDLPAGDYHMVAWCGEGAHDGGNSFSVTAPAEGVGVREHVTCRMERSRHPETGDALIDLEDGLGHLYHGQGTFTLPEGDGVKCRVRLPLTKDTNSVKVILQSQSGHAIDPGDFEITVEDDNGSLDWDNTVLPDEKLTYTPHSVTGGSAEILRGLPAHPQAGSRAGTVASAVVADLKVGRLMADHKPVLTVRNKARGKTVFRIPMIDYALMVKGNYRQTFDDQEYLDRQDEYNMTFFLDENGNWLDAYIYIMKWKVVPSEVEVRH